MQKVGINFYTSYRSSVKNFETTIPEVELTSDIEVYNHYHNEMRILGDINRAYENLLDSLLR